ncbi:30S ribosome-binding factor RbfA [Alicyclobacillus cycloheptanicus]|uniref:Ribosome-binding factor A n=1 Tax=Alicyclobacillus cycloheptanicus TaxID=1457 RepID=A0ABT9XG53_9BACL|nr:30S ribosome-binding factor RbfA [Alicyclobacillus cycloheptanicus]MDQ0189269.1 ribosome-binding factor A [Alicyclobacillus cycloheptanicus]WDM01364.1 30S ribosome-binding factor RbfA [Alicyclobacillus cycloheptanicus]
MARIRTARVAEQMKKEIADLLRTEVKDPRVGFATVTRVEVAGDLQHAKVYVSVYGDEASKQQTMQALERASGFLRGEVSRRLRMRVTPEMVFKLDESGEYSAHIETVLRELHHDEPSESNKE